MSKRNCLIVFGIFAASVGVICIFALLRHGPSVTEATFNRLRDGMTKAEVENALGGKIGILYPHRTKSTPEQCEYYWFFGDGYVTATFDDFGPDGKIVTKSWEDKQPPTILQRAQRWLEIPEE